VNPNSNSNKRALLDGKIALVTGGLGGIGRAVSRAMSLHGARVVIGDLDELASQGLAESLSGELGTEALGVGLDVTSRPSLEAAADIIEATFGVVNVIAVNAGILLSEHALDIAQPEWERVLQINLTGSFSTATVFAERLQNRGLPGSIIFTSSLFGLRGGRGNSAYSASKFGIIGLAQSMAADLAPHGIRVNSVCPGQIESDMMASLLQHRANEVGTSPAEERARFEEKVPLGRLGRASEVADGFVYLASDLSTYVTGHSLLIDGGWQVG